MNKQRRILLEDALCRLQEAATDEQNAVDNLPEGIRESERADQMECNVCNIEEAIELIQETIDE